MCSLFLGKYSKYYRTFSEKAGTFLTLGNFPVIVLESREEGVKGWQGCRRT
jgi:hypothetical protein